jgi:hypothetical protein
MATAATTETTPTGSMLAVVRRWQAGDYQQAAATQVRRLPVGWDPTAQRGTAGYDLVLATPRTLSALAWFLVQQRPEVTDAINRGHAQATDAVAVELAVAVGAHPPTVVDHCYDSARSRGCTPTCCTARSGPPTRPSSRSAARWWLSKPPCTSGATTCCCAARSPS